MQSKPILVSVLVSFLCLTGGLASTRVGIPGAIDFAKRAYASGLDEPVVGGTTSKPGAWPDVVAVLTMDGGLCTGTLLAEDVVLTAGHCTEPGVAEVIVGNVDLSQPGGDVRKAKWAKSYPRWD